MYCTKCGTQLSDEHKFCRACGAQIGAPSTTDTEPTFAPIYRRPTRSGASFRPVSLVFIILCAVLWLVGPFAAVNLITFENQPTGLEFLTGDVPAVGDLTDSIAFWASIVTLISVIVCLIGTLTKNRVLTLVFSILAAALLLLTFFDVIDWLKDLFGDLDRLFQVLDIGFWGLLVSWTVVIIDSSRKG